MRDQQKAEEIAVSRMELISPLLAEGLDPARAREIKAGICEQTGMSERTLRRYVAQYRHGGFSELKPKGKGCRDKEVISPEQLNQAILLRRQVPSRSVSQIIDILVWEGLAEPGQIKRSTLQEQLAKRGYSNRHMRMYADSGAAARRFQKRHRNQLWHSDIKYALYLPIGKDGSLKQTYLVTFIDDATRYVLHGQFYSMLDQVIVQDCFRRAIHKCGVPEAVYFDNGSQYQTRWMRRACAKMGVRLLFAKPRSPEATGKVERFNRVVDSFLAEAKLEKPQTLDQLNAIFQIWLEECYQVKPHSGLENSMSPEVAYRSDKHALKFLDPDIITQAFLHCEERKVDKSGCISFQNQKYEVGLHFIGSKVNVVFDPADTRELTIEYEGHTPFTVKPLVIGERAGKRPKMPEHMQAVPAESSRLLAAASEKNKQRKVDRPPAISYKSVSKGGDH